MSTHRILARALLALAFTAITTPALAQAKECGLIGTWLGTEPGDMIWLGVHEAGSKDTNGQMSMDWVYVKPNLLGGAARLTGGHGVWEKIAKGEYKYTWYAVGLDADNEPMYTVRVSGIATNTTCDQVDITYVYEVFAGLDMTGDPLGVITGTAVEFRLPVVTPPPATP